MSLADKLAAERRGRLAAERLLELKQAELYAANRKLGLHARALSEEIVETRAQYQTIQTEHQKVKSDLSETTQNLEIAERRLWMSISTIQDGFAFFDSDDTLIAANDAYMAVFDGLEEIRPGVAYARLLQLLTEEGIVDTGNMNGPDWRADIMRRRQSPSPEGVTIRLWNDQYIKLVEHRGSAGDVVSLGLNITSTVRYEKELKDARYKAEAAARAKSSFLANMSHEIRTPMNGVVGMAELMQDSDLDEEQRLYVDTIKNSGDALLVIINDILDYSKMDAEKLVLQTGQFDLEKSIHEVMMLLHAAAREKGVSLLIDYDMFLLREFIGDAGRIRQILTNLIGNAVKFTLEGHVLVRVTGIPDETGQTCDLHIAVEDTGIGIPTGKVEHVFGEFTQVDDERNREFEGTGLGLAITKKLVELMKGDIWVTSEEGLGSCFGFKIPLACTEEGSKPLPKLPKNLGRVMIVDDTAINIEILQRQLAALGVATDGFTSGEDALARIGPQYDLVLADHILPGMSGPEFLIKVKATGHDIPAILMSSNLGDLGVDRDKANIQAVLQRPVLRDQLVRTLSDLGAQLESTPVSEPLMKPASEEPGLSETTIPENLVPQNDPPVETAKIPAASEESHALPVFRARNRTLQPSEPALSETPAQQSRADTETQTTVPDIEPTFENPIDPSVAIEPAIPPLNADLAQNVLHDLPRSEQLEQDTVSSEIPVGPESPADLEINQPSDCNGTTQDTTRLMRVLTAEDNKTNQLVLRKMLKKLNIDLQFANNGEEAVEKFTSFRPDLIFMDISMPRMDGKQATASIRLLEDESGHRTPIIALTAHAMSGDDESILAAGLDDYLTKPFKKNKILSAIQNHAPVGAEAPLPDDVSKELRQAG